ncbi:MAG: ATP:cob(I)alamin adenosyltransferase, partial [bacterium]|nr:ATP:cob(I)alamin adenosyltransferase [bacterium]
RRAERLVVSLDRRDGPLSPSIIPYMNRLSDYLFVAAREANRAAGADEIEWDPSV